MEIVATAFPPLEVRHSVIGTVTDQNALESGSSSLATNADRQIFVCGLFTRPCRLLTPRIARNTGHILSSAQQVKISHSYERSFLDYSKFFGVI
jgi:hypothetical protein